MTDRATATGARRAVWLIECLGWCAFAWLVGVALAIELLGDRVWWTVALLYGPRWLLAAPALGLLPWLLVSPRRAVLPTLAGAALAVIPIMGWHAPLHRADQSAAASLRVFELNAGGTLGPKHAREITAELAAEHPDVAVIAECATALAQVLATASGFQFRSTGDLCLLARGDVVEWAPRDQMDAWRKGGSGAIVRAVVNTSVGPVRVGLVHLATPRNALDSYFTLSSIFRQGPATRANIALREEESDHAVAWILAGETRPTIVLGDFNLPVESAIYRRHWSGFRNAFGRAGWGTGYTKHTRFWGVRIDHVLTSDDVGARNAFTGPSVGSDHLPLIADLVLLTSRPPSNGQ